MTTVVLLIIGTPLAWLLARRRGIGWVPLQALVVLPIVLPPTVLGFYLLTVFGRKSVIGAWFAHLGFPLVFSFTGLVIGSVIFSLPFFVYPLRSAFERLPQGQLEAAAMLGASNIDRFFTVAIPHCWSGLLAASVLTFAHTMGEFGVVLMIGGNLPGETQTLSIAIYNYAEQLQYSLAHRYSLLLVGVSFICLLLVYFANRRQVQESGN